VPDAQPRNVLGNSRPPQPPHVSEGQQAHLTQGASVWLPWIAQGWRLLLGVITSKLKRNTGLEGITLG